MILERSKANRKVPDSLRPRFLWQLAWSCVFFIDVVFDALQGYVTLGVGLKMSAQHFDAGAWSDGLAIKECLNVLLEVSSGVRADGKELIFFYANTGMHRPIGVLEMRCHGLVGASFNRYRVAFCENAGVKPVDVLGQCITCLPRLRVGS